MDALSVTYIYVLMALHLPSYYFAHAYREFGDTYAQASWTGQRGCMNSIRAIVNVVMYILHTCSQSQRVHLGCISDHRPGYLPNADAPSCLVHGKTQARRPSITRHNTKKHRRDMHGLLLLLAYAAASAETYQHIARNVRRHQAPYSLFMMRVPTYCAGARTQDQSGSLRALLNVH